METGKVEFAPNYKSEKGRLYPDPADVIKGIERRAEWQSLKDAVVEAAKNWHRAQAEALHVTEVDGTRTLVSRTWFALRKAVDALTEFESKQK
jgi:hypothetical protein